MVSGWCAGEDGYFVTCLSMPTFEFIEKDDVGIVVRKDVAPAMEGALGSKLTPLGLYPADNPVLCWRWGKMNM